MPTYQDFLKGPQKVLLITGDDNSLNTFKVANFAPYVNNKNMAIQDNIFYIDLNEISSIQDLFLEDYLFKKYELTIEDINLLKQKQNIVLLFDHYGNRNLFTNIYITQNLASWQAKIVISCNKQFLNKFSDYRPCFVPYQHNRKQLELFAVLDLLPTNNREHNHIEINKSEEKHFRCKIMSSPKTIVTNLNNKNNSRLEELISHTLNQALLTNDKNIIQLLADKVKDDLQYKSFLFELIMSSKLSEKLATAAANAITILNYAKISFANMDFSNICIPNADLQYGIFYKTSFNGANLTGVNFKNANLNGADLRNSHMDNIFFGEFPYFDGQNHIHDCCYNCDGTLIAAPKWNKNLVIIIDAITLKIRHNLIGHTDSIETLHFHPTNQILASAGRDNTTRIWNSSNGQLLFTINDHGSWINCVQYSPNGQYLASCSDDGTVRIYETQSYKCIKILEEHIAKVKAIDFDSTSLRLISIDDNKVRYLWDLISGRVLKTFAKSRAQYCNCIKFSPDNQFIASDNGNNSIEIWHIDTQEHKHLLEGHLDKINSIAFDETGKHLVSGSDDKTIRVWSLESGNCIRIIEGHTARVTTVMFSPDYQLIMSASWDYKIRFWPAKTNRNDRVLKGHHKNINCIAISPNGKYIASGSEDETIRIWSANNGVCRIIFEGFPSGMVNLPNGNQTSYSGGFTCLEFSNDSNFLITACNDHNIRIWNLIEGKCIKTLKGHSEIINSIHLSPNGKYIASASKDTTIKIWDFDTGLEQYTLSEHTQEVHCVKFSPDGHYLASASGSTRELEELDNVIRIWDLKTRKCKEVLQGHKKAVWCVAFSPNQQMLASFSSDKTIRLWSFNELINSNCKIINVPYPIKEKTHFDLMLEQIQREGGPAQPLGIWSPSNGQILMFSPDSQSLIAGDGSIPLHIWSVQTLKLMNIIDIGENDKYALKTTSPLLIATTHNDDSSLKLWMSQSKNLLKQRWYLAWTSKLLFDAKNCQIDNAHALSRESYHLLKQRGVIGNIDDSALITTPKYNDLNKRDKTNNIANDYQINIANPINYLERKIQRLTEGHNEDNDYQIACTWNDLAKAHLMHQQFDLAIGSAIEAEQLLQKIISTLGNTLLVKLHVLFMQPDTNMQNNTELSTLLNNILSNIHELAKSLVIMGAALNKLNQLDDALKQLHLSVAIINSQLSQIPENSKFIDHVFYLMVSKLKVSLAISLSDIGLIYFAQQNYKEAICYLDDAYKILSYFWSYGYPESNNHHFEKVKDTILLLGNIFYFENNQEYARGCYKLLGKTLEDINDHNKIIEEYGKKLNYIQIIKQYEILCKMEPRNISYLIFLASAYHCHGIHDKNSSSLEKSKNIFLQAITLEPNDRIEAKVSYALYLFKQQNYEPAIEQLNNAISCNSKDNYALNFSCIDRIRLPIELQDELDSLNKITVSTKAFCYYLLILCYFETNREQEIKNTSVSFAGIVDNYTHFMSCSLLGYTFLRLNLPDVALASFTLALDSKADYILAKTNKEKCENMIKEARINESFQPNVLTI